MDYKKSYVLMQVGGVAGILVNLAAAILPGSLFLMIVGTVTALAAIIQAKIFFRCPHCGGHWDIRGRIPHCCPECGELIW